jgi:crossover junction endodeoxyribonuclease RusA
MERGEVMIGRKELNIILPYPHKASVNSIWKRVKNQVYLSPQAKHFRYLVYYQLHGTIGFEDMPLRLEIKIYPPDNRVRDIDNILKTVLDSLQFAKMFKNDSQVHQLYLEKMPVKKGGELEVKISSV